MCAVILYEKKMAYDKTNMVLRYHIGFENPEERFKQLKEFLKRTGIHRVILFTSKFLEESTFFEDGYYEKHADLLKGYIKQLNEMGVETGINILSTVGHVFYANDGKFNFRRAVTIDAEPSRGCACVLDEEFLEYVKKQYRTYAKLNPSVIFSDDDIRGISLGQIVCLCDEHVKRISKRVGKILTREEIKKHIYSDSFETDGIKKAFFDQMKEDLNNLIVTAADAVHEESPETGFGIMTTSYPSITLDRNLKEIKKKNYDKKIRYIRPGMDYYREGDHKEIPLPFSVPAITRNIIDDDRIEYQPEVENDTYGFFYKSNAVTNMQIVWCLVNGFRNMEINLFDVLSCPAENFEEITDMFAENIPYYNKLAELIPLNHRADGLGIYADERALLRRRANDGDLIFKADWYNWIQLDGIPIGYDHKNTPWMLLAGDDILGASRDKTDSFLKKGALIDLRAAEALCYMGYGERIGVKSIEDFKAEYSGERFTDSELNGRYKLHHNSNYLNPYLLKSSLKNITYYDNAESISYIIDHHHNRLGRGVTLFENNVGERFCILPFDTNIFLQFTNVNNKRKHQLINVLTWIARGKRPVCSEDAKVVVNVNTVDDKKIITLFNLTSDIIKKPKILYEVKNKLKFINLSGEEENLCYVENEGTVEIDKPIEPLGVLVIVDLKKENQ